MEDLMELVAASFARNGIECPAADPKLVEKRAVSPVPAERSPAAACSQNNFGSAAAPTAEPAVLLEHNFRKSSRPDSTP